MTPPTSVTTSQSYEQAIHDVHSGDWREEFRPDIPNPARVYDYLLGGKDAEIRG